MANTIQARRTKIAITYQGKDISEDLAPYLLSFSFTDNSGGKADDLAISLEDRDGLWLNSWTPSKGDIIQASIISEHYPDTLSLPCGKFTVDQIDYSYPPAIFNIKAVSSSVSKSVSQEKHSRSWENLSLKDIAADIAANNGLSLYMSSYGSGTLDRIDQTEQSDLEFLKALCEDYGQECKIQQGQIVIYDLEEFEAKEPITTISINDERLISIRFSSKSAKVYKKAKVKYHDALKDEDYEADFEDDDIEGSERELLIHERVRSMAEAENLAKNRLKAANNKEITGSLNMLGDIRAVAGQTITLEDFGAFSGKHFISKATHKVDSSGYTVSLELGMPKAEKSKAKSRKKKSQAKGNNTSELYYEGEMLY